MNPQESPIAGLIEPGWQLYIDDQWYEVAIVIESETPDGTRYTTIVFEDSTKRPVKFPKTMAIQARPPHQPSTASCS